MACQHTGALCGACLTPENHDMVILTLLILLLDGPIQQFYTSLGVNSERLTIVIHAPESSHKQRRIACV